LEDERKQARRTLSQLNIITDETNQELMLFSKQIEDLENLLRSAKSKLKELLNQDKVETQQPKTLSAVSSRSEEAAAKVASEAAAEAVAAGQEAAAALKSCCN